MPQIQVIAPLHVSEPAKLRVCAYVRVSSDSANQLNSFASQVRYYTNLISGNEDWTLVDIYADRGITGTSTAKRAEFQRMMEDCRKGKIDRILVAARRDGGVREGTHQHRHNGQRDAHQHDERLCAGRIGFDFQKYA